MYKTILLRPPSPEVGVEAVEEVEEVEEADATVILQSNGGYFLLEGSFEEPGPSL
jgi:hypothetical protein